MKHFIKQFLLSSILVIALTLCSCNQSAIQGDNITPDDKGLSCVHLSDKSPYEQGIELIELITEMAENEAYIDMAIKDETVSEIIKTFAVGDRSDPLAVYAITWTKSTEEMLNKEVTSADLSSMSDELRTYAVNRYKSSILTAINAQSGHSALAATSICTAGKSFVSEDLKEDTIYLYTYKNAKPVAVTFTVNEDNCISASATFVSNDDFNYRSSKDIEAFFNSEMDLVKVKAVNK